MTKATPCVETGWAEFGKFIAILACVVAGAIILWALFSVPADRHKEVMNELRNLQSNIDNVDTRQRYMMGKSRQGGN